MDWRRRPGLDPADPNGVADLLARACEFGPGQVVQGTRFLFRTVDMIEASRQIEGAALLDTSVPLMVGVQRAERLDAQAHVYGPLVSSGVRVFGFGITGPPEIPGVEWTQVPDDPLTVESQWYVVHPGLVPAALVGFELRARDDGKRVWEGFLSRDPDLVQALADHLHDVHGHRQTAEL